MAAIVRTIAACSGLMPVAANSFVWDFAFAIRSTSLARHVSIGINSWEKYMHSFEEIRAYIAAKHPLRINDPYLICFDVALEQGKRHQGLYLAELNDEAGATYLRVSTPIGPLTGMAPRRRPRFNL